MLAEEAEAAGAARPLLAAPRGTGAGPRLGGLGARPLPCPSRPGPAPHTRAGPPPRPAAAWPPGSRHLTRAPRLPRASAPRSQGAAPRRRGEARGAGPAVAVPALWGRGLQAGESPLGGAAAAGPPEHRGAFCQLPVFPSHTINTSTPKLPLVDAAEAAVAIPLRGRGHRRSQRLMFSRRLLYFCKLRARKTGVEW